MNEMFKDWGFWKPIVTWVGGFGLYFGLLAILPKWYAMVLAGGVMAVFMVWMLYFLGKSHYDLRKSQMDRNYKKLTGKEANEE